MTSDDVSVIWKSAFSFTMSKGRGGGDAHQEQSKSRQERRHGNKKGGEKTPHRLRRETHNLCHVCGNKTHTKHNSALTQKQRRRSCNTCTFRFTRSWMPIIIPFHYSLNSARTRVHKAAINTTYRGDSGVITVVQRPGTDATEDHTTLPSQSRFYQPGWLIIM